MSKVEPKTKPTQEDSKFSKCPKCGKGRYVTEPGMTGTKHCPDCGHWTGLVEWTKKMEAN